MPYWLLYGLLAVGACYASWTNVQMRQVGVALIVSWALSNLSVLYLSPGERPPAYTVCEAFVMSMAFLAFVCGAGRSLTVVVAVSLVSVALNLRFAMINVPTRSQLIDWQIATNVCFALECLTLVTTGLYARTRSDVASGGVAPVHYGASS